MRELAEFPAERRADITTVLTDIDDTLTTEGRLTALAYQALERLHHAGFQVIPITGRPAGWCDHIARMWPVDGIVGENGAFYFRYLSSEKRMIKRYLVNERVRTANRRRLDILKQQILQEVPGAGIASDQHYREADLAIDFCEDVKPLSRESVMRIVSSFEKAGAKAKISSIHVNGWFGDYDKLSMTRLFMKECFDIDLDRQKERFVFVGDSPNDAPMFGFFPNSVGVANVREFEPLLAQKPAYVTRERAGNGFAELAEALPEFR